MANLSNTMVTKAEQEKTVYTYKVDFASLKSEIQLLEKNDFTMMRAENERLQGEIEKLRQRLREEITRTQANVRLDLNLEKGRIRDEASGQEIKIKETDTRIESEIAGLRTQMEAIKFQILQYMVGKYHRISSLATTNMTRLYCIIIAHTSCFLKVPLLVLEHLSLLIYACFDRMISTFNHQVIDKIYTFYQKQKFIVISSP